MQASVKPALFLHIQKTAGTSIQEMARQLYGNDGVLSHGDYEVVSSSELRKYPFISGHFGFEFARPLMTDRYCFTFLRDPVERLLSLYRFCRQRDESGPLYDMAKKYDLEGFLRLADSDDFFRERLWNNQTWQLAYGWGAHLHDGKTKRSMTDFTPRQLLHLACINLDAFDYVGFVETFDHDISKIMSALTCTKIHVRHSNASKIDNSTDTLSRSAKKKLAHLTGLDKKLYKYALQRRHGGLSHGSVASG